MSPSATLSVASPIPGAQTRQVAVDGVRFALHRSGPSRKRATTPVLLLHGVPETSACWRDLAPELARDRVVLAPDLKGLGESEPRAPYDMATVSRELAALVMHEIPDGPVDVVGHDWGGSIALALAGHRPDLVRRLVVINAPYRYVDFARAAHIPLFAAPGIPEAIFRLGGAAVVRSMFRLAWKAPQPLDPEVVASYEQAYADPARVAAMLGYYRAAARPRLRAALARQKHEGEPQVSAERSLVVWGAADPVMTMRVGESVVRDLGRSCDPATVSMLTVPGVGHWPVEEAPAVVVPAIAEFLRAG